MLIMTAQTFYNKFLPLFKNYSEFIFETCHNSLHTSDYK